jgi:hypothetical protein
MNKRLLTLIWAATAVLVFFSLAVAAELNPHLVPAPDDGLPCTNCHNDTPALVGGGVLITKNLPVDLSRYKLDGVAMCGSCHDATAYHQVGIEVDFPVPADLPLNEDNEMICLTCHYVHGRLDSERPQASFSFLDRLMNADRLHKSFLLRRNNSDGELCLTCHNPSLGSK